MQVLTYKKRGQVANLFVACVSMLLAASLFAEPNTPIVANSDAAPVGRSTPSVFSDADSQKFAQIVPPAPPVRNTAPVAPSSSSVSSAPERRQPPQMRPPAARNAPPPPRSMSSSSSDPDIRKVVPQTCVPATGQFIWNFEEEEIGNILKLVSNFTCKTMVIHDTINKSMKMTIIGKSLLTPKDAWDVLMASLAQKGLTMIEQGKTWTVVKRPDAKYYSTPFYAKGENVKNNEEMGTLFYKAEHASQDSLKNIGRLLISKDGVVESIGDQFVLIIDSNSNLRRLGNIFAQIDMEDAQNKVHILRLMNADAKTVEKQLRDLFDISTAANRPRRRGATEGNKTSLNIDKIIADERTNGLILICDQDTFEKTQQVVAMLDVKDVGTNKGTIHVKRLRYADAKKVAETLNTVVQQGTRTKNRFARPRDEATNELFEGEVKVTAHEDTNTLVTVATSNDYRSLLATINKLDVRKEQVYVEAVIMDINVSDKSNFGIGLFSGVDQSIIPGLGGSIGMIANPGGTGIASGISTALTSTATAASDIGGLGNQSIGALAVLGNFLSGGVAGLVGPPIGKTKIPSFGAVLQALATNSSIDVLSTPYLLTTDNQEAVMSVGQKVPVIKGASSVGGGAGGLGVPLQNISYEDVKLTFKITPHVGEGNIVRLDIDQEVNELGQKERLLNADQYRINTKTAKTTIVLKDQQTGVIGGLMHNRSTTIDQKIPFLGDIPILGWLFKNRGSESERKSLALIITPYIIKTDDDYKKIVDRKMKEREEFANLYYGGKIQNYNKTIDYEKKAGPISSMILAMDAEMSKIENGGPGDGTETVISPSTASSSASDGPNIVIEDPGANVSFPEEEAAALFEENTQFNGGPEEDFLYPEDSSMGVMEPSFETPSAVGSNQ